MDLKQTRLVTDIDFARSGRQISDLRLRPSDNSRSLGYHPIPIACLSNGSGPTLLVCAGNHGDEFEGIAAILRLMHRLDLSQLSGRLILIPALNGPAVAAATRCSPLDGGNLNRSFPGHADGGPTQQIAHFIEHVMLPECDAAIDIHSGGRASEFLPLSMYVPSDDAVGTRNHELARAFGAPYCWIMSTVNGDRSFNAAATRQGVPMFATELGGGGYANATYVDLACDGILRVMANLGMWSDETAAVSTEPSYFGIPDMAYTVTASVAGLFVPATGLAQEVEEAEPIGTIYSVFEPERPSIDVAAPRSGLVVSQTRMGLVERGDFLLQLAMPVSSPKEWPPVASSVAN